MDELRKEWCDNLDSLIKCPVCTKKLSGSIYICESGHNICGVCTKKVSPCMLCSKPYTSIRNSIAEVLAPQADQIKAFIMGTGKFAPKKINKAHKKIMVTEEDLIKPLPTLMAATSVINEKPEKSSQFANQETWGQFSCWIDRSCSFTGIYGEIVEHMKKSHPDEFEEDTEATFPYTKTWPTIIYYGSNAGVNGTSNRAFKIRNGLFLLNISLNHDGEMRAGVLMYANSRTAFKHSYKIEIKCNGVKSFIGQVDCSRVHKNFLFTGKKGVFIGRNDSLFKSLEQTKRFTCTVELQKTSDASFNDVTSVKLPNTDSKPRVAPKKSQNRQNFKGPAKNNCKEQNNHPHQSMTNTLSGWSNQLNKIPNDYGKQQFNPQLFSSNINQQPNMNHHQSMIRPPQLCTPMSQMGPSHQQYPLYPNLQPEFMSQQHIHQLPPPLMMPPHNTVLPSAFPHTNQIHKPGLSHEWMNPNMKNEIYQRNSSMATAAPSAPLAEERQRILTNQIDQFERTKKINKKDNLQDKKNCVIS